MIDSFLKVALLIKEASENDFANGQLRIDLNGNLNLTGFRKSNGKDLVC